MQTKKISYLVNFVVAVLLFGLLQSLLSFRILSSYSRDLLLLLCINAIMTISLNLSTGLLGELTLGHAGFMAIGAYTSALLTKNLPLDPKISFLPAILVAALFTAACAYLIGLPVLRLRGDYLAIVTLAFGEIISIILQSLKITGGAMGLSGIPRVSSFPLVYFFLILTIYSTYALIRSRQGRAIVAIREDDIAAEATGVPLSRYKSLAFCISAFFAGIGGALFAHYQGLLAPEKFNYNYSIDFMVMVVFGGMGSITGSVVAAGFLTLLPELLRSLSPDLIRFRFLIYAALLILLMIFRPEGLFGRRELSQQVLLRLFGRGKSKSTGPERSEDALVQENLPPFGTPEVDADVRVAMRTRIDSSGDEPLAETERGQR